MIKKIGLFGLIGLLIVTMAACGKPDTEKPVTKPVVEEKKEEPVLENLEDEEAARLIEKVRTYAEVFDLDVMDKSLRQAIKDQIASGSSAEDSREAIVEVIAPIMEASMKQKVAEGLIEYTGQATKEDIELIYSYMNTGELIDFVASYEIQRLKQEGFLR